MIGVCDTSKILDGGGGPFKRDLLFFDQLGLVGAEGALRVLRDRPEDIYRQLADELEYLLETPFFEPLANKDVLRPVESPANTEEVSVNEAIKWVQQLGDTANELEKRFAQRRDMDLLRSLNAIKEKQISIISRLEARWLSREGKAATSNVAMPLGQTALAGAPAIGDVVQLSVNLVPVPADTVPWEDIFALKQDDDVTRRARKLRLWASEQVASGKDINFLSEKIKDLVSDYERAIKAHRIKTQSSVIRTVVVGAAGVLEDICKARFEKAAERIFSARVAQADMLLAEASAPGLELSLITLLKERLSSASS